MRKFKWSLEYPTSLLIWAYVMRVNVNLHVLNLTIVILSIMPLKWSKEHIRISRIWCTDEYKTNDDEQRYTVQVFVLTKIMYMWGQLLD